jgi:signal transduction histidine kinase
MSTRHLGGWWKFKREVPRTTPGVVGFLKHQLTALKADYYLTNLDLANHFFGRARRTAVKLEHDLTTHAAAELFVFSNMAKALEVFNHHLRNDLGIIIGYFQSLADHPERAQDRVWVGTMFEGINLKTKRMMEHLLLLESAVNYLAQDKIDRKGLGLVFSEFLGMLERYKATDIEQELSKINSALFLKQSPLIELLSETIAGFLRATDESQVYELLADAFNQIFKAPTLRIFERNVDETGAKQKRLVLERSNGELSPSPFSDWQKIAADSGSAKLDAAEDIFIYSYFKERPADFNEMIARYQDVEPEKLKLVFYKLSNGDIHQPFAEMWELYTKDFSENDLQVKKLVVQLASMSIKRIREETKLSELADQLARQSFEARLVLIYALHEEAIRKMVPIIGYLDLINRQMSIGTPESIARINSYLDIIMTESKLMSAQLRSWLMDAEKGTLKINLALTNVNLADEISKVLEAHKKLIDDEARLDDIKITVNAPAVILALCDRRLATDVIRELFNNALKYSEKPRRVNISLEKQSDGNVLFSISNPAKVRDNELEEIFTGRADPSRPDSSGGGLFTARPLIEKMGGKMWTEKSGDWLVIKFTLPIGQDLS